MNEQERQQYIERSNRMSELYREYKELQHKVRMSMLPLREGNSLQTRMEEIERECWTHNVDIKKWAN